MKTQLLQIISILAILILPSCERNENPPVIADQFFYLDENSRVGTLVGTVEARDLDEQHPLTFEIVEGNSEHSFTLEWNTGKLLVRDNEVLDFETTQKINLQVLVCDNHPNDPKESSANISVVLNNLNEHAPEMKDQLFSVYKGCQAGTIIGRIIATDIDSDQSLTFKMEAGNEAQLIQLDTISGLITVKDESWFNDSLNKELVCMVSVCDNDSMQAMKDDALITIRVMETFSTIIDINGYAQKGPYILGSSISISELTDDLQPTGRVFSTQVSDNSGIYNLPSVELESRYILITADGFYFNERNGELSEAQFTLNNLVDIWDQESFNINMISHLQKDRIIELVQGGMGFQEAKQMAQSEILEIFGFTSVDQLASEEMNIARSGDDNAMLLAISLIFQGYRTTGELSEFMSRIILDFRGDGTLDDESLGEELINAINTANLQNIRQSIEQRYAGLGVEYEIPEFERYVNQFIENFDIEPTNQFVYPASGSNGLNYLNPEVKVAKLNWDEVHGHFIVDVPEGRSLKFDVIHDETLYIATFSGSNMVWGNYERIDGTIGHNLFECTSTGECSVDMLFVYVPDPARSNLVTFDYYEDGATTPTFSRILQIEAEGGPPIDSTLFK